MLISVLSWIDVLKPYVVTTGLMITSGANTDNVTPGLVIPSNDCPLQVQLTFKHSNVFY